MTHRKFKPGFIFWLITWFGLFISPPAAAVQEEDILKPEEAFRYEVNSDGDRITVRWLIEPEHYLYKKRMGFTSRSDDVELGDAILPRGKLYVDEFFGEMETYRGQAEITIPIISRGNADDMTLELRSQGCADIGLCYPPQAWTTTVSFDKAPAVPAADENRLKKLFGTGQTSQRPDDPLPAEIAFRPAVTVIDPFNLRVTWAIEDGYYLYRDSLKASAIGDIAQTGPPAIPEGILKWDEHFGDVQVFYTEATADIPVSRASPQAQSLELLVEFQGCKENSICYPVQMITLDVELPVANASDRPRLPPAGADSSNRPISEQDRLSQLILDGNLLLIMATFAGLGLLLAFTPCVLPMVPILSGIIAGQGKDVTTGRAFALSLTFVLGMAVTYTIAGASFAAAGGQIQAALQKPWIIIAVALLFVALAISMFGVYELQIPAALQTRLARMSNKQKTGTFIGTAIMGILSALIVTTCVAPPLVASMTVIAQAGDITRGALSLFAMSMGMGVPLLVVGTSAGRLLPKAGAWMDTVKGAFGFMLLGLAIWMLERILPAPLTLLLWAALVLMAGVFMGAFQPLEGVTSPIRKLGKGFGLMALLYGAALTLGALNGAQNPLQPLRFGSNNETSAGIEFKTIKSVTDLDRELSMASANSRPVMLDFYADWCVSCKEMEHYTFTDETVKQSLAGTVLLQADVTENDEQDRALLQRFGIFGPPTIVFFSHDGVEQKDYRVVGYMPAATFAGHVDRALSE